MERESRTSVWNLEPEKHLSLEEAKELLNTASRLATDAKIRGRKVAIRSGFIIHLALSTGLRVSEIAFLSCSDLFIDFDAPAVLVRKGKGNKRRIVFISTHFKKQCTEYLIWKKNIGEPTAPDAPLIRSSNTKTYMSIRGLQYVFKRLAAKADLPSHYSIHSLRHTYGCMLYITGSYNIRLVQKQLGHSNIKTTQVYADAVAPDVRRAVEKLWK